MTVRPTSRFVAELSSGAAANLSFKLCFLARIQGTSAEADNLKLIFAGWTERRRRGVVILDGWKSAGID